MDILKIENLSKSFGNNKVLDGVTFSVKPGEIVGLLGKNGSGKTTVLKIINDLLTIDKGEVTVMGEKISEKTKAVVSFLPERTYLEPNITVNQAIDYFAEFYADFDKQKAYNMLEDLELLPSMKLNKMSKGMKEKVQLVLVMSRNAKLYILDEPLGGVDPATREHILQTILKSFGEGNSLIITTHMIADVENILDRAIFIDKGKIVLDEFAETLRERENASIDEIFRRTV